MKALTPPQHIRVDAEKPDYRARAEWITARLSEGHKPTALAAALGVKRHVIYNARRHYIPSAKPPTTKRPCLTCGKRFASEGPHNRMCRDCRRRGDPFSPR